MCGITGIYAFNEVGRFSSIQLKNAVDSLGKRGPDYADMSLHHFVNMGHTRLSVIDLSHEANQPMKDDSGRYTIVFNGEIYNYQEIREYLKEKGISFRTQSDTEVLLNGFIYEKEAILDKLNGFFAFAIYDTEAEELFLARDRLGIKPLLIYEDEDKVLFASEMKALLSFGIPKDIDYVSLKQYLQFNYIPPPSTIFKHVRKLKAGYYLKIRKRHIEESAYYTLPKYNPSVSVAEDYEQQKKRLLELLDQAVQKRLVSDVPLGSFLSGGIDSSVITALASRHTDQLNTFSIGYRDEPFFDETKYANLVANKFKTNHTVFSLSNTDLYDHLYDVLDYLDEPFADSSALAVYILSKYTRRKATVALSGDGADELFSGYNKHSAEYRARKGGMLANTVKSLLPLWQRLPKSRNGFLSNKVRQFERFGKALHLSEKERYWAWATFAGESEVNNLLKKETQDKLDRQLFENRKDTILKGIENGTQGNFNDVLYTDLQLVLQGDMLTKVDMMSMVNSLEVRVPFLDHELVNYAMSLPASSKINSSLRKRILQDTFQEILPRELYKRPKHGFEVPLLKWFRTELRNSIENDWLQDDFVREQGIFEVGEVQRLKQKLFSKNPEDVHARIWALIVFQYWWKKWVM